MSSLLFNFDEASHAYTLEDGARVPSATQVLRMTGWVNFEDVRRDVLENKRDLGKAVHACSQYFDDGDLDESTLASAWIPYLDAWKKFRRELKVEIIGNELCSIGEINGMPFGMTYDRLGILDGEESLFEIKCSANREEWWGLQLAGYDLGTGQCKTALRRKRYAVQLQPTGNYKLWPFEDPSDYDGFTWALATTWLMLNRGYKLEEEDTWQRR